MNENSIFSVKPYSMLLAASTAVVWAFAFPLIKLGINEFDINGVGSKTLFAGVRFFTAGVIVLLVTLIPRRGIRLKSKRGLLLALLVGLVNTALHYFCYYIGLSNQSGSRSAVIDSMGSFLMIIAACAFFKDEKMTPQKALGCVLGFSGILTVNIGGGVSSEFSFSGDGMLMLSAAFFALGGIITRIVTADEDAFFVTGISLAFGGLLLITAGAAMGGSFSLRSLSGSLILCCLIAISVYGFSIYNRLISCNPVGDIAIFNSLIPIMGVTFSCVILGEPFKAQYIIAGLFVAAGIFVINRKFEVKKFEENSADV